MLNGQEREVDYNTTYTERQPYLTSPTQISLSNGLAIMDLDVGPQFLTGVNISITGGKNLMKK